MGSSRGKRGEEWGVGGRRKRGGERKRSLLLPLNSQTDPLEVCGVRLLGKASRAFPRPRKSTGKHREHYLKESFPSWIFPHPVGWCTQHLKSAERGTRAGKPPEACVLSLTAFKSSPCHLPGQQGQQGEAG